MICYIESVDDVNVHYKSNCGATGMISRGLFDSRIRLVYGVQFTWDELRFSAVPMPRDEELDREIAELESELR